MRRSNSPRRVCAWGAVLTWAAASCASSTGGSTAVIFSVSAPVVLGAVGLALDYTKWSGSKSRLQAVADQAALAAARELKLISVNVETIQTSASNFVMAMLAGDPNIPTISTNVSQDLSSVTVEITQSVATVLAQPLGLPMATVQAKARARVTKGLPLCVLTLDTSVKSALLVAMGSNVTASGCAVKSNSKDTEGLSVLDSSVLKSQNICSSGGYRGNAANFQVQPQTDCPAYPDPLAARPQPVVSSSCDYTNKIIVGGTVTISPGTYCGGLNITAGADVTANPGVYIIKNGALTMTLGAKLKGNGVGFFLTGTANILALGPSTTIDISAPIDGSMAGILLWEDRNSSGKMPHVIASQNARNLLGTLYFPNGQLAIGSPNPVADASFYTIIVARYLQLVGSPNLVLNSNYAASVVPVPQGLGNTSVGSVALEF